ncbi:hypothetical protein EK904_002657 [Melospiza melodia maxima]|nr:hypothetical protein EK904_002657 [Melospiza melodia maxima]
MQWRELPAIYLEDPGSPVQRSSYLIELHTDDGGSYDVVSDASSPAARECCAQQGSARHNWEMNYQEAAIYLQLCKGSLSCAALMVMGTAGLALRMGMIAAAAFTNGHGDTVLEMR